MEAQSWWERLAAFAQGLDPDSGGAAGLRAAASAFIKAERHECAEACLRRLGDKQVPFGCFGEQQQGLAASVESYGAVACAWRCAATQICSHQIMLSGRHERRQWPRQGRFRLTSNEPTAS